MVDDNSLNTTRNDHSLRFISVFTSWETSVVSFEWYLTDVLAVFTFCQELLRSANTVSLGEDGWISVLAFIFRKTVTVTVSTVWALQTVWPSCTCMMIPGAMLVRSSCRVSFRFSSIWSVVENTRVWARPWRASLWFHWVLFSRRQRCRSRCRIDSFRRDTAGVALHTLSECVLHLLHPNKQVMLQQCMGIFRCYHIMRSISVTVHLRGYGSDQWGNKKHPLSSGCLDRSVLGTLHISLAP